MQTTEQCLRLVHFDHVTWSLLEAREKSGTCLQCVWQRSTRSIETQAVFQCDPWILLGGITHHKPTPQNMCHTHSWLQHEHIPLLSIKKSLIVHLHRSFFISYWTSKVFIQLMTQKSSRAKYLYKVTHVYVTVIILWSLSAMWLIKYLSLDSSVMVEFHLTN